MSDQDNEWRDLSSLPKDREMYVNIREENGDINTWRWLRYKKGSTYPYIGGRWQIATEYSFKNAVLPEKGQWKPNPAK